MTFSDVFKSDFLTSVTEVSVLDILLAMAVSIALGLFIFLVYKKTFNGVMYSNSFAVTLVGLSLVTTLVILAVSSNVVLSLGMVGALSIVRFRAAIKEPVEIVYLFWSIAVGIVIGAGLIPMAVIGSVIIGLFLMIFANRKLHDRPYMLVVNCENSDSAEAALKLTQNSVQKSVVKAKAVRKSGIELSVEVRTKNDDTSFVEQVCGLNGVEDAVLVSYNGEYMS